MGERPKPGEAYVRVAVLWASESSKNLGVRALARGSRDLLRRVWDDVDIEYVDFGHRPDQLRFGRKRSMIRERVLNEHGMMQWFRQFDLIWDTRSGDSFADIYGLDRHMKMSLMYEFAQQARVPSVLAPQTIGPFNTRTGRAIARRSLRRSDLVYARDVVSSEASAHLGRSADRLTSDLVFGIDQPTPVADADVLLNVSGLLWHPNSHVDYEFYRRSTHRTISALLSQGREVTLLPHVLDSANADNDVPVSTALEAEYAGRVDLHVPRDLDDARSVIAGANLLIGARMHACLNALSTGTPAVALAYSRKFKPLLDALDWPSLAALTEKQDPCDLVLSVAEDPEAGTRAAAARERGVASIREVEADLRERF